MIGWLKHPLRVTGRLFWLAGELSLAAVRFVIQCAFRSEGSTTRLRAAWLHQTARRMLRIFRFELKITGELPSRGMLICNHLSYVDILVFGSFAPVVFVAKKEVRSWPVFGWFASLGGTVFVHREKRTQTKAVADQVQSVLDQGVLVILFPEGTSSGGETVLPFKSALLEPATQPRHSLHVGCIRYELDDGDPREEVCYWKDMALVPHLINLLSKRRVRGSVALAQVPTGMNDRKELAKLLHAEVMRLKTESTLSS
jgi:1-acyl-sn-glycerol-3-phosphate acyltransferase